jgi:hypothetical protein
MLLKWDFTNLNFGSAVMMNSPSKAVAMAQTEYSTVGGNPDGNAQGGQLHYSPLSAFSIKKRKKQKEHVFSLFFCIKKLVFFFFFLFFFFSFFFFFFFFRVMMHTTYSTNI